MSGQNIFQLKLRTFHLRTKSHSWTICENLILKSCQNGKYWLWVNTYFSTRWRLKTYYYCHQKMVNEK
jgi:hypothetical protein